MMIMCLRARSSSTHLNVIGSIVVYAFWITCHSLYLYDVSKRASFTIVNMVLSNLNVEYRRRDLSFKKTGNSFSKKLLA